MRSPWLVRTITGRFRVKWREDDELQDRDFNTEAKARAYGESLLEFIPDRETTLLRATQLRKQDLSLPLILCGAVLAHRRT